MAGTSMDLSFLDWIGDGFNSLSEGMSNLITRLMREKYDLFMAVHRVSDEIHHFFMGFVDPRTPVYNPEATGRWGDVINRFYRKMDVALERWDLNLDLER